MKTFKQFFVENSLNRVVILPGGFKPPHKGHFEALKYLINKHQATKAMVYIGKSVRDNITAEQSQAIWNIYKKHLPVDTQVEISPVTPVKSVYDYVDMHLSVPIAVGAGEEDQDRYSFFQKNANKYSNVSVVPIPPQFGRISGTATRTKIAQHASDALNFVPAEASSDIGSIKEILGIV